MKPWMLYIMNGLKLPTARQSNMAMISLVKHIMSVVPASSISTKIIENECEVRVTLNQNNIIIDLNEDLLYESLKISDEKRADFIFANDAEGEKKPWNKSHVAVIELKGGESSLSINPIIAQIEAGTKLAEQLIPDTYEVCFLPILVYTQAGHGNSGANKRIHPKARKRLSRKLIKFHADEVFIKTLRSGDYLSKSL